ncbi:MAG: NAD-dependent epimerase/dehydratase family protein [Beijerinckiaceae bacterium]|nr:NAD-dependent epimerase/dehydratase family protein [Beijerinckiaceae bacterium]
MIDLPKDGPILVTGSSGFVGSAVARQLIAEGARVRLIVRSSSPRGNVEGLDAEVVTGDLRDRDAVRKAMQGVRAMFHVAADYRIWAPNLEEIVENNLDMTRCVMDAALEADVPRIVYTSSVATLKVYTDGRSGDETEGWTPETAIGAYKRSKVVAERLVERMVAEQGLPAVIVNPSTPIGPRDIKPTPTGRVVLDAAAGRLPAYVDTGLNLVHVDDVAAGHLAAYRFGRVGDLYVLGGENVELRDMLADIAGIVGRKPPKIALPRTALFPVAYLSELAARLTGREPMATLDALRMAKYHMFFSSEKAKRDLGYTARPYREALREAIDWFRSEGRLP